VPQSPDTSDVSAPARGHPVSPDLVLEIGADGRVVQCRSSHSGLLVCPADQVAGRDLSAVLAVAPGRILQGVLAEAQRTGEAICLRFSLTTATGIRWFESTLIPRRPEGPGEQRSLIVIRDVTDPKRMEDRLRQSQDLQRIILDQMQEAVVFADEQGVIRHINAFACSYLNTSWEETVGRDLLAFHDPAIRPRIREIVERFRGNPDVHMVSHQRPLGDRELIFRFSAVRGPEGRYRGIIANLIDVTEIRQLELELQQARRMESVARLAAGVAHDFNNLMVSVIGLATCLRRRLGEDHPQAELLTEIEQAGVKASELADRLVEYSRSATLHPLPLDLNAVIRAAVDRFRARAPGTLEVTLSLADNLPPVHADLIKMEQVVLHLLENGAAAMDYRGRLRIATARTQPPGSARAVQPDLADCELACIAVQDEGGGMDAETARRAFEPYSPAHPGGSGLDLACVHGIIASHGGYADVESAPGRGSTFRVYLPFRPARADHLQA